MQVLVKVLFDKVGEFVYDQQTTDIVGEICVNTAPMSIECFEQKGYELEKITLTEDMSNQIIDYIEAKGIIKPKMTWGDVCKLGLRYSADSLELIMPYSFTS